MRYVLLRGPAGFALYDNRDMVAQWGLEEGHQYVLAQVQARTDEYHEESYRGNHFPKERPMLKIEKRGEA